MCVKARPHTLAQKEIRIKQGEGDNTGPVVHCEHNNTENKVHNIKQT